MTSRIGPFALEDRIPNASCTYRAVHVEQSRRVALKVFTVPFGTGNEARLTFAAEWERLKALKHANIVRCFGGGLHEMQGYLVHEWLATAESLRALIDRRERFPADQVVDYAKQLVAALEFAHANDMAHLALAPDKILIMPDSSIKIADFRWQRDKQTAIRPPGGIAVERARYMAPEQFAADGLVGPKTDMYSLGCVLYEMLTGHPPLRGATVGELEQAHTQQVPESVTRIVLDCPIWLSALVQQLLEKDAAKRPHSIGTVRLALEEAERRIAQRASMAEHVTSGLSAIKTDASRKEAEVLLGRKRKIKRKARVAKSAIHDRPWFLVLCLALLTAVAAWALWPPSEETLFRRAEALIATGEDGADRRARDDYLLPLLRRYPDGEYAVQAQAQIDRMDMELAETRLRVKLKQGRELKSEGERLLAEAWQFQQFGDSIAALEKFKSMRDILPDDEDQRAYRNIAQREINALEASGVAADRKTFLADRLRAADDLRDSGSKSEAIKIWRSIVSLYRGNSELESFVKAAEERIKESTEGG